MFKGLPACAGAQLTAILLVGWRLRLEYGGPLLPRPDGCGRRLHLARVPPLRAREGGSNGRVEEDGREEDGREEDWREVARERGNEGRRAER